MIEPSKSVAFVVAICGLPGALKTALATRVAQRFEAPHVSLGSFIPRVRESGGAESHPVDVADRLHEQFGGGYLVERALETVPRAKILVVEGLRHPGQLDALRRVAESVFFVELTRSTELRHEAIRTSTRVLPPMDPRTLDERNLRGGLERLLGTADKKIQTGADDPNEIERVASEVWHSASGVFRDWLIRRASANASVGVALKFIQQHDINAFLVGGVLRDSLFLRPGPLVDLDVVLENGDVDAFTLLDSRYGRLSNRHGTRRYALDDSTVMDAWSPVDFAGSLSSIPAMLGNFDVSVNAVAIRLRDGEIVSPVGGLRDINDDAMTILESRWAESSRGETAVLCLRLIRLAARLGLRLTNPEVLKSSLGSVAELPESEIIRRAGPPDLVRSGLAELSSNGRLSLDLAQNLRGWNGPTGLGN